LNDGTVVRPAQNAAASASATTGITTGNGARSQPVRATRDAETAVAGVLPEDKLSRSNAKSRADWNRIACSFPSSGGRSAPVPVTRAGCSR